MRKDTSLDTSLKLKSETKDLTTSRCCNKTKCSCVSFLWKGVNVNLGSSDEGMYGETRERGLRTVFRIMLKYGLDQNSILLDIGSGRGAPNIVASFQNQIFSSVGIELDENPYYLSLSNVMYTLENYEKFYNAKKSKFNLNNNINETKNERNSIYPRNRIGFMRGDATMLNTFEPVTHLYSFDAAMPIWMVKKFVDLFNISKTTYCYVSYRKDLIDVLDLDGIRVHGISTQMMGSGEGRMCWLYLKKNWREIRKFSINHISNTFSIEGKSNSKSKNLKLSKINSIHEIVEISTLSIETQKSLVSDSLNDWFSSRKSRKECISERRAMNQRHKELKQLFINRKLLKEDPTQLTLEDVGVSVNTKVQTLSVECSEYKNIKKVPKNSKLIIKTKSLNSEKFSDSANDSVESLQATSSIIDTKVKKKTVTNKNNLSKKNS